MPASPGSQEYGDPDLHDRILIMSSGFEIRIKGPDGVKLTEEQLSKAAVEILLRQWNPRGGSCDLSHRHEWNKS